jgi:hypothetical protein
MFATAGRSRSCGTRMRCLWIRPVPIEHILALRLRIAVSLAAIDSLVGFRRRSTQRDRALLRSHFHFVSEIWHEVVPHANATSPGMAPSLRCSRAKNIYLAPAACRFQEERPHTLSITCADFGGIDIVESIGRKHGERVDADGSFRLPLTSSGNLDSSLSTL